MVASLRVPIVLREAVHTAEDLPTDQCQGAAAAHIHQGRTLQAPPLQEVHHQVHPAEGDKIKHISQ